MASDSTERDAAIRAFTRLANEIIDSALQRSPEWATVTGEHRYDDRLSDHSEAAASETGRLVAEQQDRLNALDLDALPAQDRVDADILANRLAAQRFAVEESREHTWNPLLANPGRAVYGLLARDFAPLPQRLRSLAARLAAIPDALATARATLGAMPRVHIETALDQFAGTASLISAKVDSALTELADRDEAAAAASRRAIDAVRPAALAAIEAHRSWLAERLAADDGFREPRLGAETYHRKLSLVLDTDTPADAILARAEAELDHVTGLISAAAAARTGERPDTPGLVRRVLDQLAADAPDGDTILDFARAALERQTAFVREADLVTTFDDPVEVIAMPEIDRGVAVAYCDAPGPLEQAAVSTFVAVSPPPVGWSVERVASFYAEYNRHMVHNLMVHEAMPGHVLQLQHERRFTGSTLARAVFGAGSFIEGWAVYAERAMADAGYPGEGDPGAVRLQQLKMRLRSIINTILDIRVHTRGMTEAEAMTLMTERGYQEQGEALGKWRRVLLTSAQLPTYYVGATEIDDLVADLRIAHPDWSTRTLHDTILAHGSPAVRHLRRLLAD
jgi:uncharacterized protein (DUF885 family)